MAVQLDLMIGAAEEFPDALDAAALAERIGVLVDGKIVKGYLEELGKPSTTAAKPPGRIEIMNAVKKPLISHARQWRLTSPVLRNSSTKTLTFERRISGWKGLKM